MVARSFFVWILQCENGVYGASVYAMYYEWVWVYGIVITFGHDT